jgi:hypothetical protein
MVVPLSYRPRKRPPQPIVPSLGLFSSIKTHPEEWYQATATLKSRSDRHSPLETHVRPPLIAVLHVLLRNTNFNQFLLPSVRSFGLSDTIPFHIQITGPLRSLRLLLSHLSTEKLSGMELNRPKDPHVMIISVHILREIYVEVNRQVVWKHCVIGRGILRAIPPQFDCRDGDWCGNNSISEPSLDTEQCIDWEGHVQCREDVKVGNFDAGKVALKVGNLNTLMIISGVLTCTVILCFQDFLIFSIQAGIPMQKTEFLSLRNAVPISLVTDTWANSNGIEGVSWHG